MTISLTMLYSTYEMAPSKLPVERKRNNASNTIKEKYNKLYRELMFGKGQIPVSAIAKHLCVDIRSVNSVLKRLERDGLVKRTEAFNERRRVYYLWEWIGE